MPINLDFLAKDSPQYKTENYVYGDLHLDFELKSKLNNKYLSDPGSKSEVRVDYNVQAIRNSIQNIFNTKKGQKILNPSFGLDLAQFLFEPVSVETAREITDMIKSELPLYEPRIILKDVRIEGFENTNEYRVTLVISIPELNNLNTNVGGMLTQNGFIY